MDEGLSRRSFLIASVSGATCFALQGSSVFADESPPAIDMEVYLPDIPISSNEEINLANKISLEKWKNAVTKALDEGEIIRIDPEAIEPNTGLYDCPMCIKTVTLLKIPATLAFNAIFTTSSNECIENVYEIKSYDLYLAPSVKHVSGRWTRVNNGKTLVSSFLTDVTWNPRTKAAFTETIVSYVEFHASGSTWCC